MEKRRKLKIYVLQNNSGSKYYRIVPQLKYMQKEGHKVFLDTVDTKREVIAQRIKWCDVFILQMVMSEDWAKVAKKEGKKVIFECDDLLHKVPKTHYFYPETKGIKNRIKWWIKLWRQFRLCDGFISTGRNLNKVYGWMVKRSFVFPNYIDLTHWVREYKKNTTDRIRLLWAGSMSHTGDLEMMKPALKRILIKYPNVQFIYVGMGGTRTKDLYAKFIYGDDFFEGLPKNRESLLPVPANIWPHTLAGLLADLAIAPLEKNYFNKFKSQCKFLEYSINKIPAVYSKWFYTDVREGGTGLLADTLEEWEKQIERLIKDEELRRSIGENAYKWVLENENISNYLRNWENFVRKVYES